MNKALRKDAEFIIKNAIQSVKPDVAVKRAMSNITLKGRVFLAAIGKAAWQMAKTAVECLENPPADGIVITKYDHIISQIDGVTCYEGGHPVPDENCFLATQKVLDMTENLNPDDTVLFLISGGGSALFEKPLISGEELFGITQQLLSSGADIVEMNTIRKRLSAVKGGRFAKWCYPAKVEAIILSDILGDPLDMIASGPAAADPSTCEAAFNIVEKYNIILSDETKKCLAVETPKQLSNVNSQVIGSVRQLCESATRLCTELGYKPIFLTDSLSCQAKEAGAFLGSVLKSNCKNNEKIAYICGGETVVHLTGKGLGGRNQELALSAATEISGISRACVISAGSDGTDGPTDAAGGYVDGDTLTELESNGLSVFSVLKENDAYNALKKVDGLIITGPTGTNVNDITLALLS